MTDTTLATKPPSQPVQPPPIGHWRGPLAFVNQPSSDGRYLKLENYADLQHRQMPLALLYQEDLAPGHDGGKQGLGVITKVWAENGQLMGEGMFDMADPEAASIARKVADGYLGHVSVDLEPSFDVSEDRYDAQDQKLYSQLSDHEREQLAEMAAADAPEGEMDISPINYLDPDEVGKRDRAEQRDNTLPVPQDRYSQHVAVFSNWKLMSATLVSQPAFADARISMSSVTPKVADQDTGTSGDDMKPYADPNKAGGKAATAGSEAFAAAWAATRTQEEDDVAGAAPADLTAAVTAAMAAFADEGLFALPVADGNPDWDGGEAEANIAKWASSDGSGDKDKIDWGKYAKGFLYKDPDGDPKNMGTYGFPYCDVIGGQLKVIPKAVFAAAARLDGSSLTDPQKKQLQSKMKGLYAAIGRKQGRKLTPPFAAQGEEFKHVKDGGKLLNGKPVHIETMAEDEQAMEVILNAGDRVNDADAKKVMTDDKALRECLADPTPRLPDGTPLKGGVQRQAMAQTPVESNPRHPGDPDWDEDEKGEPMPLDPVVKWPKVTGRNVITSAAAPVSPPASWFSDPALPGPTPITVTRDGRVLGHLAAWNTCHTGFPDQCVRAPRSKTGYSLFHVGSCVTAEGEEMSVGVITMGTDHASTRSSVTPQAAMAHYADTGCAVALVRAGEDEFGVWIAGALVPEATDEQVAALRRSPLSGDWRRYGSNLELIAALAVNTPGFPIPRAQARTNDYAQVASLTAAGVLTPRPEAAATASGTPCDGSFTIDIDALTEAVVAQVEKRQAERAMAAKDRDARMTAASEVIAKGKKAARDARANAARKKAMSHRNAVKRIASKINTSKES